MGSWTGLESTDFNIIMAHAPDLISFLNFTVDGRVLQTPAKGRCGPSKYLLIAFLQDISYLHSSFKPMMELHPGYNLSLS